MGFKWICPECSETHQYGGNATTKATARCCDRNFKIWQYRVLPPKPPEKPPQATPPQYKTTAHNKGCDITIEVDYKAILKCMERGISTIKNKPEVKAKSGGYYWDYLLWSEQFEKLKLLEMGDEK